MRAARVGDLLGVLEGVGVRLVSDPAGRQLAVRHPVLADGPPPPTRGGVLLMAGAGVTDPDTSAMVRAAAARGYGAVAVRLRGGDPTVLTAVADSAGVALLAVDDELEWLQLATILTSVLSATSQELLDEDTPVGDLFGLVNAIAAATGGATAVEDLGRRVLAYSTVPGQVLDEDRRRGILGRQVPDLPENESQYRELFRSTGVVRFPATAPALPRVAIAIRAGSEPLGSLWVVDAGTLLPGHQAALTAAAEMAALHLLRARSAGDVARQRRADLMRDLLSGVAEPTSTLDRLGLSEGGPVVLLGCEPTDEDTGPGAPAERLADLVSLHLESRLGPVATCVIGGRVYALVRPRALREERQLTRLATDLVTTAASSLRLPLAVAIGPAGDPGTGPAASYAGARQGVDRVLDLLRSDPSRGRVATVTQVADQLALVGLRDVLADEPRLVSRVAEAAAAHDARHGTAYGELLLTWLEHRGDVGACARRLDVHANTVRYRLGRARELFGLDPGDPDQLLLAWLSLRVRREGAGPAR